MRAALFAFAVFCSAPMTPAQCVVHDLNVGAGGAWPTAIVVAFGQDLYFNANVAPHGNELYKWDAATGLHLLADINPGGGNSNPQDLAACCTAAGPRLFFNAFFPGQGAELWSSDGTAAGTALVKDIRPGSSSSDPGAVFACHDRVFFHANDGANGSELWVSDGTLAGTYMILDINPGSLGSQPELLACFAGRAFFTAWTATTGRELYVSDGSAAGTFLLADIYPGANSASIHMMTICGGKLFFPAYDNQNGGELWTTDGTTAGTTLLADIAPNSASSSPLELTCCGDTLFFLAQVSTYGRELWKSDGTAAGTVLVKDVRPGAASSGPSDLICAGDRVFFAADSFGGNGRELWVSDGTAAGTLEVDVNPGAASSFPQQFAAVGTGVCFYAVDALGSEVWFSDGTATNTFQVCDINPGSGGSIPQQLTVAKGRLFFAANHPTLGNELFEMQTPGAVVQTLGQGALPSQPSLRSRNGAPPVLGTTIDLDSVGPAGALGVLVAGPAQLPIAPLPGLTAGACDWAGVGSGASFVLAVSTQPAFSFALSVPNQAWATGIGFHLQTVWITPAQSPPLEPSNGLQIILGAAVPQ